MICEIDVRNLVARKIYRGELSFEFDAEDSLIDIPNVRFASPVKAELTYYIAEDNAVEVQGEISFLLKGACTRCLNEIERRYTDQIEVCFLPNGEDDGETYSYTNGKVKLDEALRDAVLFALPASFECENECELPEWE